VLANLDREEQKYLEPYFKSKKIRIRNDLNDNSEELLKKALANEDTSDSELDELSDSEGDRPGGGDEEDSEDDEDFEAESEDDDVAEEYDENANGSESEEEEEEVAGDDEEDEDEDDEEDERPAKKARK